MTDINKKHRLIAIASFAFAALILSLRSASYYTLVFFVFTAIPLFFADRIMDDKRIKERTAAAFFVFAVCYQTFYQCFNRVHENNRQLMTAAAVAVFLAAVFALTDSKKLPYSIFAAPLICLLDIRVASAYCFLLLMFSVTKLKLIIDTDSHKKKSSKGKKKKTKDNEHGKLDLKTVIIISTVTSAVFLAVCIYVNFKNNIRTTESLDYLFRQYKNLFGFIFFIIYFMIKLIKSDMKINIPVIVALVLDVAVSVVFTMNYGWSFFSLFLVSFFLLLGLVCFESEKVINEIKADFNNHRYLFLIGMLCLLQ